MRLLSLRAVNLRHVAVANETGVDGPRQSGISALAQKLQPGLVDRQVDFRFRFRFSSGDGDEISDVDSLDVVESTYDLSHSSPLPRL